MSKVALGTRTVFANLAYIRITPWVKEEDTLRPGDATYDVTDVVADTTTVEQAENEANTLEHEFSSSPLYENIQVGDKTFACESIDLQNEVLKGLFGWKEIKGEGETVIGMAAPVTYEELYALIELGFNSTKDIVVLPKVLLNSRAVIASMKTDASRANINGTCYPAMVGDQETDMAIIKDGRKDDDGASVIAMVSDKE